MAANSPVVIVGAGLSGAAAAWALSRRGVPVTVVEQYAPGHRYGSSHGSARIVRRAYGDALYVGLTGRAFELWRAVEAASGATLLRILGGLDFGSARDVPAVAGFLRDAGVPHEVLPPDEAETRWPGMVFDGPVVFHPQAGTLDAERAVTVMLDLAAGHGAELRYDTAATAVSGTSVRLADGSTLPARCVVVAAGGWLGPLLDGLVTLPPLTVTRQQVFHFPRRDPSVPPWPSVIHEPGPDAFYHLAGGRDGGPGDDRKIGDHYGGPPITAGTGADEIDPAGRARVIDYVQRWLPGLDPEPSSGVTCLYTRTPSEDFLLDRVEDLIVCSPCSGHGAKFAPLIGEWVAALVLGTDGEPVPDRFRLAAHAAGLGGAVSL
jgi:sarcosine oxidase